ncbi:transcriptional regulator, XRE family [Catenulispora acidiphila DSM 44928]|uniref:Transcriptional regulator, XRE family n=1 Tax=Catenulispora acidiphila (strain DSM 44928 / JCM 14897 / NBRC 102108 / NRRL B-24433 / ID139908) TaxID=479433 RepID=C7PYT2_CATAD|nr:helix-turn-helix domain-containing protein [Catenulispora acidiphila]ACU77404.1 transcriptional regulator, XRE family [Catenulispora acidiphila DSM 44928]
MLEIDDAAKRAFEQVIGKLRSVRRSARISQAALSHHIGVLGKTISEWENLRLDPTLVNLTRWSDALGWCLVVIGPDGKVLLPEPLWLLPGETRDSFGLRRLAGPLKSRRQDLPSSQKGLGRLVGVSGSSISYWELVRIPPRSIAQFVWAQKLGCSIALWPNELSGTGPYSRYGPVPRIESGG